MPRRPISDIMTSQVKTLAPEATLLDAMSFMREHGVRHIPIVDGDGRLAGLLTDRDVKRATPSALLQGDRAKWEQAVRETQLKEIMTTQLITTTPQAALIDVVQLFVDEKIGCIPVVEMAKLQGIVTSQDLLRSLVNVLRRGEG